MTDLTFLVHRGKEYTVRKYLESWGQSLASRIRVAHYPGLRSTGRTAAKRLSQNLRAWRVGVLRPPDPSQGQKRIYVFTDLERLSPNETKLAMGLYRQLEEHPATAAILNHPLDSMRRFELLTHLRQSGSNQFAIYRADDLPRTLRWPVFVRDENEHGSAMSPLIGSREQLDDELQHSGPGPLANRVVVEFCDTADDRGVIRKYGAFCVGGRILARQIHFSRHWVVRVPDIRERDTAGEELEYVESNPHGDALAEIFQRARIDYGRIDYGLVDGKIQVWEINTNPMILIPRDRQDPLRFRSHDHFGRSLNKALEALMSDSDVGI